MSWREINALEGFKVFRPPKILEIFSLKFAANSLIRPQIT